MRLTQIDRREISREQQIADSQLIIERTCKSRADQAVELLILFAAANGSCGVQKFSQPLSADLLPDTGMKNFNRAILDLAANYSDAITLGTGLVCQAAQEFRAFGW